MRLALAAALIHDLLLDVRRRLEEDGASGSTIIAAEVTLAHLLPLLLAGPWRGTTEALGRQCGRAPVSIRRSLRTLERAGALRSRPLGRRGLELRLLLSPRDDA